MGRNQQDLSEVERSILSDIAQASLADLHLGHFPGCACRACRRQGPLAAPCVHFSYPTTILSQIVSGVSRKRAESERGMALEVAENGDGTV